MKEDVAKNIFTNICSDFKDVLLVGIEENKEQFPFSIACIDFIYSLKEQGINASLSYFSENIRCELYEECKRYLVR
ncbi:MAG: hypothetical protein ACI4VL_06490 [Bacilli bacterium]